MEAIRAGKPSPIPFGELAEVTETTFLVQRALATGEVLRLGETVLATAPGGLSPDQADSVPTNTDSASADSVAHAQ
jgi:hypothetical protein